jgi:hypothetical protein
MCRSEGASGGPAETESASSLAKFGLVLALICVVLLSAYVCFWVHLARFSLFPRGLEWGNCLYL